MPESGCLASTFRLPKQRYAFTTSPLAVMSKSGTNLFHWPSCSPGGARHLVLFCLALNLIGPRAVDVLSELSYAPMTPDHFPSLFCKVGANKVIVFLSGQGIFLL